MRHCGLKQYPTLYPNPHTHPSTQLHTLHAIPSHSIAYSKWVPYLTDPRFNRSTALTGLARLGPEYDHSMMAESLTVNALAAGLVALAVLVPCVVANPRFRFRPQRVITVAHDRYG